MSPPNDHAARFAAYLAELTAREDRAALAALRRGSGKYPGEAAEMHRYVLPWVPPNARVWQEEAYYSVAALFALHPKSWRGGDGSRANLGASFRLLSERDPSQSVERRFVALLNSHPSDLTEHLRRAVGLLKSREIPVDWA